MEPYKVIIHYYEQSGRKTIVVAKTSADNHLQAIERSNYSGLFIQTLFDVPDQYNTAKVNGNLVPCRILVVQRKPSIWSKGYEKLKQRSGIKRYAKQAIRCLCGLV